MARLNLTLEDDTLARLDRYARCEGKRGATLAREILTEGLARREAAERRKKLAADYAAGRADAYTLLKDLEAAQLDVSDDDEAA